MAGVDLGKNKLATSQRKRKLEGKAWKQNFHSIFSLEENLSLPEELNMLKVINIIGVMNHLYSFLGRKTTNLMSLVIRFQLT